MEIGLFFGSFNPIHVGHLIIANTVLEQTQLDKVWFVVSPQNPFKKSEDLLHEFDRFDMVQQAIHQTPEFGVTDVEFNMPKPSYTADTLAYLDSKYPQHNFKLIIGEDNLYHFPKWKNHEAILEYYGLIVYPRPNAKKGILQDHQAINFIDAPVFDISATFIRKQVANDRSIKYLVTPEVEELIISRGFYK